MIGEYDSIGNEIKSYGYQPDSTWGTDPLFMKVGSDYYFYHNDHLGTPQKMTASNGAVVWSAYYDSFGDATVGVETVENNLRFPGQYYDRETGLHYNWFRYYDPGVGRYIRLDPIGFGGGNLNLYAYVLCNPITKADRLGLFEVISDSELDDVYGGNFYWYDQLPDCPCSIQDFLAPCGCPVVDKLGSGWSAVKPANREHPGAVWEIRWYKGATHPGQQCTYDFNGNLITEGPAAGTPDRYGWDRNIQDVPLHGINDFVLSKVQGSEKFLRSHPPNNGNNCDTNKISKYSEVKISEQHKKCGF